jgi:DUF3039 family protein
LTAPDVRAADGWHYGRRTQIEYVHIGSEERSMSVTPTTTPETMPGDTDDGDEYAHYARAEEITRAAIEGGKVTALCGFKFEPVRDPVCPRCKEFLSLLDD